METESGNYLNVTLKNKILSTDTVLNYLEFFMEDLFLLHQDVSDSKSHAKDLLKLETSPLLLSH